MSKAVETSSVDPPWSYRSRRVLAEEFGSEATKLALLELQRGFEPGKFADDVETVAELALSCGEPFTFGWEAC